MDILTTVAEYKHHLKAAGYARATIDSYRKNLDQFTGYLESLGISDLRQISHQTICDYQSKVSAEPVAQETKALKLRPVKRLFEHLVKSHRLLINPCDGIVETCRKHRKIGPVLTVEEVKKLMDQPDMSSKTGIRNRAVMEVLYSTAIRLGELLSLEIQHAALKDRSLYIRKAKGRKQRVVPLGKSAVRFLKQYLQKVRPCYAKKNPGKRCLWLNQSGKALSGASVYDALFKYRTSAGICKPVSAHTFRRSCATHLLQQGVDIRYIQKLLGHRSLKTTQAYTQVLPVEVKKTHERTHPGSKIHNK